MKICRNCGKTFSQDIKYCTSCGSSDISDSEMQVSEYKRVCNECGTKWHSLVAREDEIKKRITNLKGTSTQCCNMCDDNARKDNSSKLNTYAEELDRLHKCPNCNSGNYEEELVMYEKK